MAVWAFACKLESSLNRWFDGTDQDVYVNDNIITDFTKGREDYFTTADMQRKGFIKNVGSMRYSMGSMLFNEVMFNAFSSRLTDYDDAIFMVDDFEIRLSRAIVRLSDTVHPLESFQKTIGSSFAENIPIGDYSFIHDYARDKGFGFDTATTTDIATVGFTKTITPTIDDSFGFTETVYAGIGGRSIRDNISLDDSLTKSMDNVIGDATYVGTIGSFMFNELVFNGQGEEATIATVIGLTEEVQIILTH